MIFVLIFDITKRTVNSMPPFLCYLMFMPSTFMTYKCFFVYLRSESKIKTTIIIPKFCVVNLFRRKKMDVTKDNHFFWSVLSGNLGISISDHMKNILQ